MVEEKFTAILIGGPFSGREFKLDNPFGCIELFDDSGEHKYAYWRCPTIKPVDSGVIFYKVRDGG